MPLEIDSTLIPVSVLAEYLLTLRRIGKFEVRQAAFFGVRLPNKRYSDDFQTLMLLLLACLSRGYPGAGKKEMTDCVRIGEKAEAFMRFGQHGTLDGEWSFLFTDPTLEKMADAVASWFERMTVGGVFAFCKPLIAVAPLAPSVPQPLIVFDPESESFFFQAYYAAKQVVARVVPSLLKTPALTIDKHRAAEAIGNALLHGFRNRITDIRQASAVVLALFEKFLIVSGGPGTGKSTVINCIVRAVSRYHEIPVDEIVLCAPTGRAKARLLDTMTRFASNGDPFAAIQAKTLHALLEPGEDGTFRFSAERKLPYRLVVMDEVSMVDLRLFARLLEALIPSCRMVLVGDMEQLPPVDAGGVLGDLTSRLSMEEKTASLTLQRAEEIAEVLSLASVHADPAEISTMSTGSRSPVVNHLITLTRNYRSDQGILRWWADRSNGTVPCVGSTSTEGGDAVVEYFGSSELKRKGAAVAALENLYSLWISSWNEEGGLYRLWKEEIRHRLIDGEKEGEIVEKLGSLIEKERILCCIHEGPFGRLAANDRCDRFFWRLKGNSGRPPVWHDGQPLIVNRNQAGGLELYNGDLGIVLEEKERYFGCFVVRNSILTVPVDRIIDIDLAYAVSVHKAQGSEFDEVMLVVPDVSVMPITRPLVYTAVTRAKRKVIIIDPADRLSDITSLPSDERPGILREILEK